jgi:hypothetical protein
MEPNHTKNQKTNSSNKSATIVKNSKKTNSIHQQKATITPNMSKNKTYKKWKNPLEID